jgi:hypothetical protein
VKHGLVKDPSIDYGPDVRQGKLRFDSSLLEE